MAARADDMARRGLFEEVRLLLETGKISPQCSSMQASGYKEAVEYIEGRVSREEAVERIKLASRRYAKRQLTWLRRDAELEWILWPGAPDINEGADRVLRALARGNFFKFCGFINRIRHLLRGGAAKMKVAGCFPRKTILKWRRL